MGYSLSSTSRKSSNAAVILRHLPPQYQLANLGSQNPSIPPECSDDRRQHIHELIIGAQARTREDIGRFRVNCLPRANVDSTMACEFSGRLSERLPPDTQAYLRAKLIEAKPPRTPRKPRTQTATPQTPKAHTPSQLATPPVTPMSHRNQDRSVDKETTATKRAPIQLPDGSPSKKRRMGPLYVDTDFKARLARWYGDV